MEKTQDKPQDKQELIPVVTMDASTERRLTVVLLASLATLLAGGAAVNLWAAPKAAEVIALADLSGATLVEIREDGGAVVLSGEFRSRVDALGNTEKDADLGNRGGDSVIGEVELEIRRQAATIAALSSKWTSFTSRHEHVTQ